MNCLAITSRLFIGRLDDWWYTWEQLLRLWDGIPARLPGLKTIHRSLPRGQPALVLRPLPAQPAQRVAHNRAKGIGGGLPGPARSRPCGMLGTFRPGELVIGPGASRRAHSTFDHAPV